jgi:asparagine synthase (glutamine-hydrolysing)
MQQMLAALARRGPDDEGMVEWNGAVLGHRRLAIFDLSPLGHQPMTSPDGHVGVVFNGAIYNFKELRQELSEKGYSFKSRTDTEVLLHGYAEWGIIELVRRLRGMFAFGLWDDVRRKLFLVRDRLGVKPLVFSANNGTLAFASTTRALRAGGFARTINDDAIVEFMRFGFITDDHAVYREAMKVPAGGIIEWAGGRWIQHRYWDVPVWEEKQKSLSFVEAVERTEQLLLDSVRLRLEADVPVAALLSGGIDSALVCWAVTRLGGNVKAFTVSTPGDDWDEAQEAKRTARILGISHEILSLSGQDVPDTDELATAYSEPFACESGLGMLGVSKLIAENAKVLLTGDGGDDLFLGYPEHLHLWVAEQVSQRLPNALAEGWSRLRRFIPRNNFFRRGASFLDYSTSGINAVREKQCWLDEYDRNGILGERIHHARQKQYSRARVNTSGKQVFKDFLIYHQKTRFVGQYLPKVDGATMYYGLEARSPFLDHVMWEWGSRLHPAIRLRGWQLKAILRELTRRKIGPEVANRKKTGFRVPVHRWISRWQPTIATVLKKSHLQEEGWIQVNQLWKHNSEELNCSPSFLWYAYVLENWLRKENQRAEPTVRYSQSEPVMGYGRSVY